MTSDVFFNFTIVFSLIIGSIAGVLSVLSLEILRQSPFGRTVLILTLAMAVFIFYHVALLLIPAQTLSIKLFKSTMFTGIALFVGMMIWDQHQMRRKASEVGE